MSRAKMQVTQKMIDSVFSEPKFRKKFSHPLKDKHICEMRVNGAIYKDIAKRYRMSEYYCKQTVARVARIYTVFLSP